MWNGHRAYDDLSDIDAYWWTYNPQRGDEILDRVRAAGYRLIEMPHAGPQLEDTEARKWRVRGLPYILIYRVHAERIEILRVHHGSEDWPKFD